jgi:patatin-like phospholipase/acyl hydrolase
MIVARCKFLRLHEESKSDEIFFFSFVMAVNQTGAKNHAPVMFRSYINPLEQSTLPSIKIWQAARATSAAPMYFEPLQVNGNTFMDGGLQANNPLGW